MLIAHKTRNNKCSNLKTCRNNNHYSKIAKMLSKSYKIDKKNVLGKKRNAKKTMARTKQGQ